MLLYINLMVYHIPKILAYLCDVILSFFFNFFFLFLSLILHCDAIYVGRSKSKHCATW